MEDDPSPRVRRDLWIASSLRIEALRVDPIAREALYDTPTGQTLRRILGQPTGWRLVSALAAEPIRDPFTDARHDPQITTTAADHRASKAT